MSSGTITNKTTSAWLYHWLVLLLQPLPNTSHTSSSIFTTITTAVADLIY